MRHVVPRNENLFEFRLNAKHSMRLDEHEVFVKVGRTKFLAPFECVAVEKEVLDEGSTTLIVADQHGLFCSEV